ncbi:hypothetical protein [Fodinibius sp. AD559]|uniref:hypothetical protein n=1 Tax=Fodinibius sp. AD559 TaxID=3424179 RepID=UPI004046CA3D
MNKVGLLSVLILILFTGVSQVFGQDKRDKESSISLKEVLQENRYELSLENDKLKGEGGKWLIQKSKQASVVTIGEMHATKEIPKLIQSLITSLDQKNKFDHLALEASPWTVERMTDSLKKGKEVYNSLIEEYPNAIPFYNFKAERDLVYEFVEHSNTKEPVWGLDQVFAFTTGMAFDRLEALAPDSVTHNLVQEVRGETGAVDDPRLKKLPDGIPNPISIYVPAKIEKLKPHFEDIPEAQQILTELIKSIEIYRLNDDDNYTSNQVRAKYLRKNLWRFFQNSSAENPRLMIKIGARHAYRGMTPNNALDVGNLAVSLAESMDGEALNIAVLCGQNSKNTTFPARSVECQNPYLNDEFRSLIKEQPTLFDFSSLHAKMHDGKLNISEDLEVFLWAFDAAIFIPNTKPAEPIVSPVN